VSDLAIATRGLTKRYGRQVAVDAIDLAVPTGSVFGFLGPNGSGKTSTIRILLGLAYADSGEAQVLGQAMPDHRREVLPQVGALVEGPAHYPFLTGVENLTRFDAAAGTTRAGRAARVAVALDRVGLAAAGGKKVRAYSLGMKQRLGLAAALLAPRALLVLDEPTNGLDPQGTREVRSLVRELAAEGSTVFLSSHLLSEVEQVCTHAAVMSAGRLVVQGPLDEIRARAAGRITVVTPDARAALGVLTGMGLGDPRPASEGTVSAVLGATDVADVTAALVRAGVRVRGISDAEGSLEDVFVALTGEGFEVVG
jgi:ABC-2 type transport system ATP-binding protein